MQFWFVPCTMLIPLLLLLLGVLVAKFLKFFKLVEDQPVTFCAKYMKARNTPQILILCCTGLEQTSLLFCCRWVMWTKITFTLSFLLGWAFSHEFLFFSKSNDLLARKEFLAIGCWYGLTTLYTGPCWLSVRSCPLPGWFLHLLFYLCSMWFSVMTSVIS